MKWTAIDDESDINRILEKSHTAPVIIFKHSTRCAISAMAKSRLDKQNAPEGIDFYYLDLLKHRDISNRIASRFEVKHESPQILCIHNEQCVYHENHNGIDMQDIIEAISSLQ